MKIVGYMKWALSPCFFLYYSPFHSLSEKTVEYRRGSQCCWFIFSLDLLNWQNILGPLKSLKYCFFFHFLRVGRSILHTVAFYLYCPTCLKSLKSLFYRKFSSRDFFWMTSLENSYCTRHWNREKQQRLIEYLIYHITQCLKYIIEI